VSRPVRLNKEPQWKIFSSWASRSCAEARLCRLSTNKSTARQFQLLVVAEHHTLSSWTHKIRVTMHALKLAKTICPNNAQCVSFDKPEFPAFRGFLTGIFKSAATRQIALLASIPISKQVVGRGELPRESKGKAGEKKLTVIFNEESPLRVNRLKLKFPFQLSSQFTASSISLLPSLATSPISTILVTRVIGVSRRT
jgi:hypothetical protein